LGAGLSNGLTNLIYAEGAIGQIAGRKIAKKCGRQVKQSIPYTGLNGIVHGACQAEYRDGPRQLKGKGCQSGGKETDGELKQLATAGRFAIGL
jgi:hypothetical protein